MHLGEACYIVSYMIISVWVPTGRSNRYSRTTQTHMHDAKRFIVRVNGCYFVINFAQKIDKYTYLMSIVLINLEIQ